MSTDDWRLKVIEMLKEGFGVEDIAIRTASCERAVRNEVARLRINGVLKRWYPSRGLDQ